MTSLTTGEDRCSRAWRRDDLPAWGTAPRAAFWVALEQPGPWGAKALTQSRGLDPTLGAELEQRVSAVGGRLVLIRRPGRHADEGCSTPRWVLMSGGPADARWSGRVHIVDPAHLLDLLAELTEATALAQRPAWLEESPAHLLVCTNGKRDQCCALDGRTLATELDSPRVWEASHLGGHRFAPTALVLPTGQALARLTPAMGRDALAAADQGRALAAGPLHDRGLSHLAPAEQVVDAWSRHTGRPADQARAVQVESSAERLPSSCGADAIPVVTWQVEHA